MVVPVLCPLSRNMTVEEKHGVRSEKMTGNPAAEIKQSGHAAAVSFRISNLVAKRKGRKLCPAASVNASAIGRALSGSRKFFLFDEPLSNLDVRLRVQDAARNRQAAQELGATMNLRDLIDRSRR